jgi:acetyltransferase
MDLQKVFKPQNMAVVGVSHSNDRHPANVIFNKNRLRYPVNVYAVNPKGGCLYGEKVYSNVSDIPEIIDLVVIVVKADYVPEIIADCIAAGAGGAIIVSGGFSERGRTDLQDRLADQARKASFPILGPNCLGYFAPMSVDTFFIPSERMVSPYAGQVALISQSGGILVDQMVKFTEEGLGLSMGISIGNKAVLKETDLLHYLDKDEKTQVIAFYIEGFGQGEGREFVQAAQNCNKPIVVLKSGKTSAGIRAVSSHTASMAGDNRVFSSVLNQHGIIEANNEMELLSFCKALKCYPQTLKGNIGIVTGSGGHGAMSVDFIAAQNMQAPALSPKTQTELHNNLSKSVQGIAAVNNPVDLTGSALDSDFAAATSILSKDPQIDAVLILLLPYSPGLSSDVGALLSDISRREGKPVVAYVPHIEKYSMIIEGFELNRVPVSGSVEGAVFMLKALMRR